MAEERKLYLPSPARPAFSAQEALLPPPSGRELLVDLMGSGWSQIVIALLWAWRPRTVPACLKDNSQVINEAIS